MVRIEVEICEMFEVELEVLCGAETYTLRRKVRDCKHLRKEDMKRDRKY